MQIIDLNVILDFEILIREVLLYDHIHDIIFDMI